MHFNPFVLLLLCSIHIFIYYVYILYYIQEPLWEEKKIMVSYFWIVKNYDCALRSEDALDFTYNFITIVWIWVMPDQNVGLKKLLILCADNLKYQISFRFSFLSSFNFFEHLGHVSLLNLIDQVINVQICTWRVWDL